MEYCEQIASLRGFEPWNAITNAAFVLAALAGRRALRGARGRLPRLLPFIAGSIGLGSFAWHATGAAWAEAADVLPIALFVVAFLASALRGLLGFGIVATLGACTGLVLACLAAALAGRGCCNGSAAYLPVLAGICGLAVACLRGNPRVARGFALAAALFAVSLLFRTIDLATCEQTAIGTHWLWHLLNGLLLAQLMALLGRHLDGVGAQRAIAA